MLTAEINFLNASSRINLVHFQNINLIVKFTYSFFVILFLLISCENGKVEKYKKKKKEDRVYFPHTIHAKNNIDCKYCHNQEKSSKKNENVCLDCHKQIKAK
jgi:hypothetical protein